MPGIPMGPWPLNVTIHNRDTATITIDQTTGMWWWRTEGSLARQAFAVAGTWYWRRTGELVAGHCRSRLEAAFRVYQREEIEEARARKASR